MNDMARASDDDWQAGGGLALVSNLKSALRRMPSAVALISTCDPVDGSPAGLAASAVIPVSLEPPSMLISINRNASAHSAIERSGMFCINLLGVNHTALVGLFSNSKMRAKRFSPDAWQERHGLPYLADAPANVFCRVCTTLLFGTHEIFVGEVFDLHKSDSCEPLGWLDGNFATHKFFDP
jgi:flavin reductase (DIM6/NTAB) family NADH-FMN oxidoreductase RutF